MSALMVSVMRPTMNSWLDIGCQCSRLPGSSAGSSQNYDVAASAMQHDFPCQVAIPSASNIKPLNLCMHNLPRVGGEQVLNLTKLSLSYQGEAAKRVSVPSRASSHECAACVRVRARVCSCVCMCRTIQMPVHPDSLFGGGAQRPRGIGVRQAQR